jgi:hypothetical protein
VQDPNAIQALFVASAIRLVLRIDVLSFLVGFAAFARASIYFSIQGRDCHITFLS